MKIIRFNPGMILVGAMLIYSAWYMYGSHNFLACLDLIVGLGMIWHSFQRIDPPGRDPLFDPIPAPSE